MRIEDFELVRTLNHQRDKLRSQIEIVKDGSNGGLGITIQSHYQDEEFVDALRPAVVEVLKLRLVEVENRLRGLGVIIK